MNTTKENPPFIRTLRAFWLETAFLTTVLVFVLWLVSYLADIRSNATVISPSGETPAQLSGRDGPTLYEAHSARPAIREISPIFTPSVQYWEDDIVKWAAENSLDPNLVATVMQIESCGLESAGSSVGAMGLFQVMPFHFTEDDKPFDPDTNARVGMAYLRQGFEIAGGNAGLALAGYNGGHGLIYTDSEFWPAETLRYTTWGTSIYRDASTGMTDSPALQDWLIQGGGGLCALAEEDLGL